MISFLIKAVVVSFSVILLGITSLWLYAEARWAGVPAATEEEAFAHRSIGLETLPLKYAVVLERLSAAAFRTGSEDGRSLWQTYGFLDNPQRGDDAEPTCVGNASKKLPVGFAISRYVPTTAVRTPVEFVGLTCATCHSTVLRETGGQISRPIFGAGNAALDVIAWSDGVRSAVLDPGLSSGAILNEYDRQCGAPTGWYERTVGHAIESIVISAWLRAIRGSVSTGLSQYDMPFHGRALNDPLDLPAGPSRTRPFRSVVRVALNLPGADNMALSKIPAVFEQTPALRPRSQYDGSIGNSVTRSMIAAYSSGASVQALSLPEIAGNVRAAAAYTDRLGIEVAVPGFAQSFPDHVPDPARVASGRSVYMGSCNACHGNRPREGAPWSLEGAGRIHRMSRLVAEEGQAPIGTDPARLTFRYADKLPLALWTSLPGWAGELDAQKKALADAVQAAKTEGDLATVWLWNNQLETLSLLSRKYRLGHPFYFPRETVTYDVGYINNPIPFAYLRAPYLHNASVPTLSQLINLTPRPAVFCRGANDYDPVAVGYVAPAPDPAGRCPPRLAFRFDTSLPGNSNQGHDFPWRYDDPARDPHALEDLLAYLTTL